MLGTTNKRQSPSIPVEQLFDSAIVASLHNSNDMVSSLPTIAFNAQDAEKFLHDSLALAIYKHLEPKQQFLRQAHPALSSCWDFNFLSNIKSRPQPKPITLDEHNYHLAETLIKHVGTQYSTVLLNSEKVEQLEKARAALDAQEAALKKREAIFALKKRNARSWSSVLAFLLVL